MTDPKIIHKQLKDIKFGSGFLNQGEIRELPKIIHEGEIISECVNGVYEGGVALLIATEMRLLLIDKKPLRFLTVEDLRFDMINEIDYSHRLMSATITISTGSKTLRFKSYNQQRLRHLISLVQEHMSNSKIDVKEKAETQKQHLEEINRQLQMYLMAQHQHMQQQLQGQSTAGEAPKPSPELSDYLLAQRLLERFQGDGTVATAAPQVASTPQVPQPMAVSTPEPVKPVEAAKPTPVAAAEPVVSSTDLVDDAKREVFGHAIASQRADSQIELPKNEATQQDDPASFFTGLEVSPIRIAYSKLPMMLRNRKFGRPSLHAHSQQQTLPTDSQPAAT